VATLITKKSSTPSAIPVAGDLQVGELAVNTADGKLFTKHTDNSIKEIGSGGGGVVGLPTFVQQTEPTQNSIWYKTDVSGTVLDILIVSI
jgi:hypothetical protein